MFNVLGGGGVALWGYGISRPDRTPRGTFRKEGLDASGGPKLNKVSHSVTFRSWEGLAGGAHLITKQVRNEKECIQDATKCDRYFGSPEPSLWAKCRLQIRPRMLRKQSEVHEAILVH